MSQPTRLERTRPRSTGTCILFAHSEALIAHERAVDAGEHPHALFHLRHAIDSLERAHRALASNDGTAILHDGDAEPTDRWPTPPAVAAFGVDLEAAEQLEQLEHERHNLEQLEHEAEQ